LPNKSILERTGLTLKDLERIYHEEGSLERTAIRIGCSRPAVVKHLKHLKKDNTPWKTKTHEQVKVLASAEWQQKVFEEIDHAIATKKVWMDTNQTKIPYRFIQGIYFELPLYEGPAVPLYARLRTGERVVLLHVIKESPSDRKKVHNTPTQKPIPRTKTSEEPIQTSSDAKVPELPNPKDLPR